jgi:hypothetical protein
MSGRIIDLTVTLTNNMPAHKFFPKPVIVPHFGHEEFRQWNLGIPGDQLGGATTFIGMVDHVGTGYLHQSRRRKVAPAQGAERAAAATPEQAQRRRW